MKLQFLLILQLTRNAGRKKERMSRNECNQIFSMIYACRAAPWGESILKEGQRERERGRETMEQQGESRREWSV